jgi:ABC-type amino acid transport substrate-binding protein
LDAGLQVMVRDFGQQMPLRPLRDWVTLLVSRSALLWLLTALVVIVIPAYVLWLLNRRNQEGASLPGKLVCTVAGVTSANYLRQIKADVREFWSSDEMLKALLDGLVDAVLHALHDDGTYRRIYAKCFGDK